MSMCRSNPYIVSLLAALMLLGCRGAKTDAARKSQSSHLRSLINLYNYAATKLGHRPANEAEFKSFIAANARPMIESLKLGSADELFVSERDEKPFVVLYGEPSKGTSRDLIAYEQAGVAGKRMVGYSLGAVAEVDEQQFAQLALPASNSGK